MLESVISLMISAEVATADLQIKQTVDSYYISVTPSNPNPNGVKYTITYDVSSRGVIRGDLNEFAQKVDEILTDDRGWIRAGVKFVRVQSGGRLHMILASGPEVRNAAPYENGCSALLSCTVKPSVYINDDRWMGGSDSYNALGVSVDEYREMVVNHEVGHFLGHDHVATCETASGLAPVMLQQSTGLRGCSPNSWPLPNELWVRGI